MSNIKVVDVNEEAPKQELAPVIEEAKEEVKEPVVEEPKEDIKNNVVEEAKPTAPTTQQSSANNSEAPNTEAKVKAQDKLITCPKCNKTMKTKSYRYNHEKICQGNLIDRPVKPKAKPKEKPKPEPIQETIDETIDEEIIETPPQPKQPTNEVMNQQRIPNQINRNPLMEHYQQLQQEHIRQKQERFNNLFKSMVTGSRKKR